MSVLYLQLHRQTQAGKLLQSSRISKSTLDVGRVCNCSMFLYFSLSNRDSLFSSLPDSFTNQNLVSTPSENKSRYAPKLFWSLNSGNHRFTHERPQNVYITPTVAKFPLLPLEKLTKIHYVYSNVI